MNSNDKLLGRLIQHAKESDRRFDRLEQRFDRSDKKLDSLLSFKWKIMGMVALAVFVVELFK